MVFDLGWAQNWVQSHVFGKARGDRWGCNFPASGGTLKTCSCSQIRIGSRRRTFCLFPAAENFQSLGIELLWDAPSPRPGLTVL